MNIDMYEERWTSFCKRTGVYGNESKAVYSIIEDAYSKKERIYHNLAHIADCFTVFDDVCNQFEHPDEVEMVIWTHDIVYDIFAKDNELKSAEKAYSLSQRLGFDNDFSKLTYLFVSKTDHSMVVHDIDMKYARDIELLLDIDFAIFGKPPKDYDIYEKNIRKEYVDFGEMSDEIFNAGRIEFLKGFMSRPKIYRTEIINRRYEWQARINIKRTLERLSQ